MYVCIYNRTFFPEEVPRYETGNSGATQLGECEEAESGAQIVYPLLTFPPHTCRIHSL